MRSDLIHAALTNVPSRYLLVNAASRATRLLHRPQTQVSETVNEVLIFFHDHKPIVEQVDQPEDENSVGTEMVPQFGLPYEWRLEVAEVKNE